MKKKLFLLSVVFLFAVCLVLTSCDAFGGTSDVTTAPTTTAAPTATCTFTGVDAVYDGTAKTIAVAGLPEGATVSYSVNGGEAVSAVSVTDAGVYTVVATVALPAGYTPVAPLTATLTIAKADYKLPEGVVYFEDAEVPYSGQWYTVMPVVALPEGVSYSVIGAPLLNAGETGTYTINFGFNDPAMANNYNPPASIKDINLSVVKGDVDMSGVSLDDLNIPFDGKPHRLELTGTLPSVLTCDIIGGGTKKGSYTVTATFSFKDKNDAANYNLPAPLTATLTIGAGEFNLSGLDFTDRTLPYSGRDQYPVMSKDGLTINIEVKKGETVVNEIRKPGVYTVNVSFAVDNPDEFLVPAPKTFTITVEKGKLGADDMTSLPTWKPIGGWDATVGDFKFFVLTGTETHGVELELPAELLDIELGNANLVYTHTLNGAATEDLGQAGLYKTTAVLTYTSDLYDLDEAFVTEYTFEWRVADKTVDAAGITFADKDVIYTGDAVGIEAIYDKEVYQYITGVTYKTDGDAINVGTYTVTALVETDAASGYAPFTLTATLTVAPAVIDLSGVDFAWDYVGTFDMDGKTHVVKLTAGTVKALEDLGVTVKGYVGNTASAQGEYTAVVTFECDGNHILSQETTDLAWEIALSGEDAWTPVTP